MAARLEVEFLKVLACVAWADEEVSNAELNFIKELARGCNLTGEEWTEVNLYLKEKVHLEEMRRVTQRFASRARRSADRQRLVDSVERLCRADRNLTATEQEWIRNLRLVVLESRKTPFWVDGLKSLLRIHAEPDARHPGREADLHNFVHNRVLFRLRRRLGTEQMETEGSPEKLKKLTLSAALLARVGYVDEDFLPQESQFMKQVLQETWKASPSLAEAVTDVAVETVREGMDLHRLVQEAKRTLSPNERRQLIEGIFALSLAEGKMSHEEHEEIRKIATMLDFSHKQFIAAKLRVLHQETAP